MAVEFLLMDVPHGGGRRKSLVMKVDDPYKVTWDHVFSYIEQATGAPRRLFKGMTDRGLSVYGRMKAYPEFEYDKYRFSYLDGRLTDSAGISISFAP